MESSNRHAGNTELGDQEAVKLFKTRAADLFRIDINRVLGVRYSDPQSILFLSLQFNKQKSVGLSKHLADVRRTLKAPPLISSDLYVSVL